MSRPLAAKRCLICLALFAGCFCLGLPGGPTAYGAGSSEIDLFNTLELSEWHVEMTPELQWQVYYEDNIIGGTVDEISDFSNRYTPSLELNIKKSRFSLTGSTEVKIIEYFDEKEWNTVDQTHVLNASFEFTPRTRATLSGNYNVFTDPDRYFEQSAVPGADGGYIVRRYKNKTRNFNATLDHNLSARTMLQGMFAWSNFETGVTDDSDYYMATLTCAYELEPRTTVSLIGSYSFFDFTFSGSALGDTDFLEDIIVGTEGFELLFNSDYELKDYNLSAGVKHHFSDTAEINLVAGWRYTKTDQNAQTIDPQTGAVVFESESNSGDGFIFSLDVSKKWSDLTLWFRSSQSVGSSPDTGASYENRRVSFIGTYAFTDRWLASLSLQYYNQDADTDDEFAYATDQDSYYGSIGLQYKYSRSIRISCRYGYSKTEYNNTGRETDRRTAFLGVRFTPLRNYVVW